MFENPCSTPYAHDEKGWHIQRKVNGGKRSKASKKDGVGGRTFHISLRSMGFTVQAFWRKAGGEAGKQHDQALSCGTRSLALVLGMDWRRRGQKEGAQLRGDMSKGRSYTKWWQCRRKRNKGCKRQVVITAGHGMQRWQTYPGCLCGF